MKVICYCLIAFSFFIPCSIRAGDNEWHEASGRAGQINIEAIEMSMQKSKDVLEFEKRVNEIYTGDEMVLIEVKNQGQEQLVSGHADLNNNLEIEYDMDDKLFTFRRWYEGHRPRYMMRGYGINSYYYHPYPAGTNLFITYFLVSVLERPMYSVPIYHTTVAQRQATRQHRSNYRQTPNYRNQVIESKSFQTRMSAKHGTSYRKASPSANRLRWAAIKGIDLGKVTKDAKITSSILHRGRALHRWLIMLRRGLYDRLIMVWVISVVAISCGIISIFYSINRSERSKIFILAFSVVNILIAIFFMPIYAIPFILVPLVFFFISLLKIKNELVISLVLALMIIAWCCAGWRIYAFYIHNFATKIIKYPGFYIRKPSTLMFHFVTFVPPLTCIIVLLLRFVPRSSPTEPAFVSSSSGQVSPNTCRHCGNPIYSDSVFCTNCGKRLSQ